MKENTSLLSFIEFELLGIGIDLFGPSLCCDIPKVAAPVFWLRSSRRVAHFLGGCFTRMRFG